MLSEIPLAENKALRTSGMQPDSHKVRPWREGKDQMARWRVGVDSGGTFTDVVLETAPGEFLSGKYLTTHAAPEQAVMTGVSDLLHR